MMESHSAAAAGTSSRPSCRFLKTEAPATSLSFPKIQSPSRGSSRSRHRECAFRLTRDQGLVQTMTRSQGAKTSPSPLQLLHYCRPSERLYPELDSPRSTPYIVLWSSRHVPAGSAVLVVCTPSFHHLGYITCTGSLACTCLRWPHFASSTAIALRTWLCQCHIDRINISFHERCIDDLRV